MYVATKGLLVIITTATIIWGLIGYFYCTESFKAIMSHSSETPYWFVFLILVVGYVISVGLGFSLYYEKKLWKID